jgi:glycosyltransferase involved in cell wall biosynthesis
MPNTSKVSCIVPCYKYAHYLPECIDSLVNQTYPLHEIIIVSDGSPDNTKEVAEGLIEKYDSNIIFIEKENGGLSSARNAGIKRATGEYITCLDADDKLVPGAIEEHLKLMTDDMSIAQCSLMEFDERYTVAIPTPNTNLKQILMGNTIFCNAMFSKRVWEAVGGYDEHPTLRFGREDHEFWVRCLEYGCQVNVSDFIALRYRCHSGQMTEATLHPHWGEVEQYFRKKHAHLYEKYNLIDNK